MGKFLDAIGVGIIWNKIKNDFVTKESGKGLSTNDYTTAEKEKLSGLSKVIVDSQLSSSSTNPVQNNTVKAALDEKISTSQKGIAGGIAELDDMGKVPSAQLPSYVDDVLEGYLYNGKFYKDSGHTKELEAESGKIYISDEKTYRWSGTAYVVISDTIALGETSATAYRGDRGKTAYEHSQTNHAPTNAKANVQADWFVTDSASDAFIKNKPLNLPADGGNASTVNGKTVESNVPLNAKFTDTIYTHPTSSGNMHIPSGGISGQILRWNSDGTAVWGNDNNTTYEALTESEILSVLI